MSHISGRGRLIASHPRFVRVGVAGLLVVTAVTAVGVIHSVNATGVDIPSSFVPIVPCRLVDTRSAAPIGSRATPIGASESVTFQVTGSNGGCVIPSTANGIASNVTSVNPTSRSYLTVFPADEALPLASNLNWTSTSPPTPNQVTVKLSATGAIKTFNNAGTIDIIIDIVGYYQPSTSGPSGPAGPVGPIGPAGANGAAGAPAVNPAQVVWVAKAGTGTFATVTAALSSITDNTADKRYVIKIAPGTYVEPAGIDLKNYVDIEGSGQTSTIITADSTAGLATTALRHRATQRRDPQPHHHQHRRQQRQRSGPASHRHHPQRRPPHHRHHRRRLRQHRHQLRHLHRERGTEHHRTDHNRHGRRAVPGRTPTTAHHRR